MNNSNKYNLPSELAKKDFIWEFESSILFFEDNKYFPWVVLVSKKEVKNMLGLTLEERFLLMKEVESVEKTMDSLYKPDQINIAIFGNKVPRLHVHIIARFKGDATFPSTAFHIDPTPYEKERKNEEIKKILNFLPFIA